MWTLVLFDMRMMSYWHWNKHYFFHSASQKPWRMTLCIFFINILPLGGLLRHCNDSTDLFYKSTSTQVEPYALVTHVLGMLSLSTYASVDINFLGLTLYGIHLHVILYVYTITLVCLYHTMHYKSRYDGKGPTLQWKPSFTVVRDRNRQHEPLPYYYTVCLPYIYRVINRA